MNQLEIFKSTINHNPHKEFLFHASFTPDLEKRIRNYYNLSQDVDLGKFFKMYQPVYIHPEEPERKPDFSIYFKDIVKPENSFINSLGVLEIPAKFYHFTGYISPLRNVKSISEIESFPFPNTNQFKEEGLKEKVENAHKEGKVVYGSIGHMYESAWQIRGYQEFLMDMIERPDWCEYILDKITERNISLAKIYAKIGVDAIFTGDDVANQKTLMFSKEMWRKFIKKRWEKVYSAAKSIKPDIQIWYHSDGNIYEIIPELIEIGVTILNPLQPECMDIIKIKKEYGRKIVFDGTIGTQSTMPFGTPDEVRKVVYERKRELGYDGALIISPTHILEPEVPIENISAFFQSCSETMM